MTRSDETADSRPARPRAPDDGECCGNGCDPCVYDLYDEALKIHEQMLAAWESRQTSINR